MCIRDSKNLQTDNGSEFALEFEKATTKLGIQRYFSRVRTPIWSYTYTYDGVGNRLTMVKDGESTNYSYDEVKDRPLYIVDETTGIQLQDKKV